MSIHYLRNLTMKNALQLFLFLLSAIACTNKKQISYPQEKIIPSYSFLVGSYTDSAHQGIQELYFSPLENKINLKVTAPGVQNPSFLLTNQKGNIVYSLEADRLKTGGKVISLMRSTEFKTLSRLGTISSYGSNPCYLGLSPDENLLAVANYTGGSLSLYDVNTPSQLILLQYIQHEGKGVNIERQEGPHVHSTVFSPDGKYLLAADLGTNKIYSYRIDLSQINPLNLVKAYPMNPGDGPRQLVFSSGGTQILVVHEMTAIFEVFDFDQGKIISTSRHSLIPEDFKGKVGAAEIRSFADGKFVYVSNRGDANTLIAFKKSKTGYSKIQEISSGGLMPRNFNLTHDGKFLLVAHQASNDLVVFERNLQNGMLTPTQWKIKTDKPSYLFQLPD